MKRASEAQFVTRVWGHALPENFEIQRHETATFIDISSKVNVNSSKFRKTGTFRC